jgi:nucleoside-diphosphate-sugar epimerase
MKVFVTGATGFIGAKLVKELIGHGHSVVGMTRSEEGANTLVEAEATPHHAVIKDVGAVCQGITGCDAVIHLAFNHDDFSKMVQHSEDDRALILAMGETLGKKGPLLVTSGAAIAATVPGKPAREDYPIITSQQFPRAATEEACVELLAKGMDVRVVRLPQVHDEHKQGLIPYVIKTAKAKGISAYIGDGSMGFSAAAVGDVVTLYRLALEKGASGAKYHAVAEENVPMKAIAEAIGRGLKVPVKSLTVEEAPGHFGWMAMFMTHNFSAESAWTRKALEWEPTGPGLIEDLERMDYSGV